MLGKKFLAVLWASAALAPSPKALEFFLDVPEASKNDALRLRGDYNPPAEKDSPFLIFLHGLGSSRGEWDPLITEARKRGWGTCAYDARGHGGSRKTSGGKTVDYSLREYGGRREFWAEMVPDLIAVIDDLNSKKRIPRGKMALVGASLGANICLAAASRRPEISTVVLLSPGLNYAGIETGPLLSNWTRPLLLAAARPDAYAFKSVEKLSSLSSGKATVMYLESGTARGAHGTQLFNGKLENRILEWIEKTVRVEAKHFP